ncbi:hypothetical protein HDK77DRAFT_428216 [Phyllosticta capitalensis]|uniref:Lytic polysaccharide monooxygenase n=1 Tax=Phyllosticta capitalensis TaxID=121624 RepID=A0ABR1YHA7_9PEZI
MVSISALAALAATVISGSHAHMIMKSPVPYGKDSLNNSPLDNSGSDFPCKQRSGVYDISEVNSMPVGVPQELSFTGSATHGGGSCQISVTLDQKPTKDSEWKVIHSIIGGCPTNAAGNLATTDGASTFNFSMPEGMPNGQYTLAWTWFNKVGNREMYMNCAPIKVSGGADNNNAYNKLPDMFVANLPREECEIPENENFNFPNPGDSVVTAESTSIGSSLSGSNCAAVTVKGAGAGKAGSVASATGDSGSAATSAPASKTPAYASPKSTPANTGGVFAPGAASSAVAQSPAQTSAAAVPVTTPAAASTPATAAAPAGTGSSSCVPCSTDGAVVCMGSSQFGLCNYGCAVPQAVAAGTSCSDGKIVRRDGRVLQRSHLRRAHDRALAVARHARHA